MTKLVKATSQTKITIPQYDYFENYVPAENTGTELSQTFPRTGHEYSNGNSEPCEWGLNQQEYAAIKLRVPKSGTKWLDDMIKESMKNEIRMKFFDDICSESANNDANHVLEVLGEPSGTLYDYKTHYPRYIKYKVELFTTEYFAGND